MKPSRCRATAPSALSSPSLRWSTGFALIWHIWWMAILGLLAIAVTVLVFGWSENREREIPASEMARMERARLGSGRPA